MDSYDFSHLKEYKLCKIVYDNETKLKLDDKTILYTNNREDFKNFFIIKAFKEEDYEVKQLTIPDIQSLEYNSVYFKQDSETFLFIIVNDTIAKSYTTIEERFEDYNFNIKSNYLDCYENPIEVDKIIQSSTAHFNRAKVVLKHHFFYNSKTEHEIEWHLVNWLRLFSKNPEDSRILLEVIAAHQTINPDFLEPFFNETERLINQSNNILFTIKKLADFNGLYRSLGLYPNGRIIIDNLSLFKTKILNIPDEELNNKSLIILSEIGISGNQMINGLSFYFNRQSQNTENINLNKDWENYFDFNTDELDILRNKISKFKQISILSIAYTDKFKAELIKYIQGNINKNINITFFPAKNNLEHIKCILPNNPYFNSEKNMRFVEIIKDIDKLSRIFNFTREIKLKYEEKLESDSEKNLVVRLNSIPKKACMIFRLEPKNNTKPLFNRINE